MMDRIYKYPKLTCLIAGVIASFAMAPFYVWPALFAALSAVVLVMSKQGNPWRGGWCAFYFGIGFFTVGLWWIANALLMDLTDYWWAIGFSILGLPILLTPLWYLAGWLSVKFSKPGTLSRAVLFLTLLSAAEYGRAFNLSGFPWNLFGYMWADALPVSQLASLGGAYFVTALTMLWAAFPALAVLAMPSRRRATGFAVLTLATFIGSFLWGCQRLASHPTEMRPDTAVVIVQPNLSPDEKWRADQAMEHFMRHVKLSQEGIDLINDKNIKHVAVVWPETSLEERLVMTVPDVPERLIRMMTKPGLQIKMVTGLWRQTDTDPVTHRPGYFNSVGIISVTPEGKLNLDDLYDKHHLVPFGEYIPLEKTLGITPLVGFAGFEWGPGPRVLHSDGLPDVAPMICFEAIFPWYARSPGAGWLVNTSNDGWYGNTPGPYQHLAMTRYRAIEQGKPIARAATTGISAVIDPYGRLVQSLPYQRQGVIVSALPQMTPDSTPYAKYGESLFFLMLGLGSAVFLIFRAKDI